MQKKHKIKYGQTNPANYTNCRRTDLGQEPTSPSAVDLPGSLHLSSSMLVGGTANPSWSWQIGGGKLGLKERCQIELIKLKFYTQIGIFQDI